ncbi:DUF6270 domain-containing protein [Kocuria rosea]|uniref:DUF6270 domain-containing protein n=1 Tax=Kocuria rosea TaxID=1275 RepID=UPI000F6D8631|nr:DUF6270 domain-containing protein [Kocuria rosea]VEI50379.1 Uncharacterised protein [Kocuria rosea]
MSEVVARTYERWTTNHHIWQDLEDFLQGFPETEEGVHSIGLGGPERLDVLVAGTPGSDGRAVPVFLNGAVPSRDTKAGPFFSGGRVGSEVASGYVAISDPSVDRDTGVSLAWYAGNQFSDVPAAVLRVLDALWAAWGAELVLVGGSGGGFASLHYAARTHALASAFVWNPQTDILGYNRTFVDSYLQAAYPDTFPECAEGQNWRERAAKNCANAGIQHSLIDDDHQPSSLHRILLLQNRPDWHLAAHTAPYIERHAFRSVGTGSYVLDSQHVVQVAEWGPGHAPLPNELVIRCLREFLDGRTSALDLGRSLATDPMCDSSVLDRAPMDLRPIRDFIARSVKASAIGTDGRLVIETGALPLGYGGLRFGVSQQNGSTRKQLAWFSEGPELTVPPQTLDPTATTMLIIRDGFNHHLESIPLKIGGGAEDNPPSGNVMPPEALGSAEGSTDNRPSSDPQETGAAWSVFVYGSCVTRDAFALPGAPRVAEYVARSPVVSAMAEPLQGVPAGTDLSAVKSAFQRRMLRRDWEKTLPTLLRTVPHDVLVLDFIDERIPLSRTDAGLVACSMEAQRAGLALPASGESLDHGAEGYAKLWTAAADRLLKQIDPQRLVVNRAFWATADDQGEDLTDRFPVEAHNASLRWMYDYVVTTTGCAVIDYPERILVAKGDHHGDPSPFHYIDGFYEHFLQELERFHREL